MKSYNLNKFALAATLGLGTIFGMSEAANAQGNRNWNDTHKQTAAVSKEQERAEQARVKAEQARLKAEQDRLRAEQQRQAQLNNRNNGWNNAGVNNNRNQINNNRFRIYNNGRYYNTDQRGADLLRQAVNAGYQQGFAAGRNDRNSRRNNGWANSDVYRNGTFGYQSYVDRGQYQYYFQQGFQRGYQDGYNSRYQYGYNSGGSPNILGAILGSILNIQTY
jgi:hypothetical protein